MRTPRPWPLPHQPALRQHLLSPGVTDAMLRTRLRNGELRRLRSGVYLAAEHWPTDPVDQHRMLVRAELVTHPGAVISHESAALVWGLPDVGTPWHQHPPTITLPRASGYRPGAREVRFRTAKLPPHHVTTDPEGYKVTTLARTAVDVVRGLPLPEALVVLDATARQLCEALVASPRRSDYANPRLLRAVREVLAEAATGYHATQLRVAVAMADSVRESPIESLSAGHFRLAALPTPEYQRPIRTPNGLYFADFYWEQARLIGEADGAVKYRDPAEIVREKQREQDLRDQGYRFVRWLGQEIQVTPAGVIGRVWRALEP